MDPNQLNNPISPPVSAPSSGVPAGSVPTLNDVFGAQVAPVGNPPVVWPPPSPQPTQAAPPPGALPPWGSQPMPAPATAAPNPMQSPYPVAAPGFEPGMPPAPAFPPVSQEPSLYQYQAPAPTPLAASGYPVSAAPEWAPPVPPGSFPPPAPAGMPPAPEGIFPGLVPSPAASSQPSYDTAAGEAQSGMPNITTGYSLTEPPQQNWPTSQDLSQAGLQPAPAMGQAAAAMPEVGGDFTGPPAPQNQPAEPTSIWSSPPDPLNSLPSAPVPNAGGFIPPQAAPGVPVQMAQVPAGFAAGEDQMPSSTGEWTTPAFAGNGTYPGGTSPAQGNHSWEQPAAYQNDGNEFAAAAGTQTDFSGLAQPAQVVSQTAEPVLVQETSQVPAVVAQDNTGVAQDSGIAGRLKGLSRWVFAAGGVTVLLIVATMAYFVLGAQRTPSSLPAVSGEQTTADEAGTFLPANTTGSPVPTTVLPTSAVALSSLTPTPASSSGTYGPSASELLHPTTQQP